MSTGPARRAWSSIPTRDTGGVSGHVTFSVVVKGQGFYDNRLSGAGQIALVSLRMRPRRGPGMSPGAR